MIEYRNNAFQSLFDRGSNLQLSDISICGCCFDHCGLSLTKKLENRAVVERITLNQVEVGGCDIGPAILRDIEVVGLTTRELFIIWGALFQHVLISGPAGRVKINRWIHFSDQSLGIQAPFDEARELFYSECDWALDIKDAEFELFECDGIPARLIRRDHETQIVVLRDTAARSDGWLVEYQKSFPDWGFAIQTFIESGEPDIVLVAPKRGKKKMRKDLLAGLHELRRIGIAMPE